MQKCTDDNFVTVGGDANGSAVRTPTAAGKILYGKIVALLKDKTEYKNVPMIISFTVGGDANGSAVRTPTASGIFHFPLSKYNYHLT